MPVDDQTSPVPPTKLILELVPPPLSDNGSLLAKRLAYIDRVRSRVPLDAINIPEIRPEGTHQTKGVRRRPFAPHMAPRHFGRQVRQHCDLPSVVNHVVVHQSTDRLRQWFLESVGDYGITRFVLVGGEHHYIDYPGPSVCDANALARQLFRGEEIEIGNICIPSRDNEYQRLCRKLAAGASFFTTQVIYEPAELQQLASAICQTPQPAELYISFAPIKSEQNLRFLNWLGVQVSAGLETRLLHNACSTLEASIRHLVDTWAHFRREDSTRALNLHINLCPIGDIGVEAIVELADGLLSVDQSRP